MRKIRLLVVVLFAGVMAASGAVAQEPNAQKFDASAIFQPGMTQMQMARQACDMKKGLEVSACFVEQMKAGGAPAPAVAFMHAIDNNGFMRDFKETGKVDIAFVYYVYRANENQGCLLVNGTPNIVDVDDYKLVPNKAELAKNPQYAALLKSEPNLIVFPGDRNGMKFITAGKTANGGQRFVAPYILSKCHACARVGQLNVAFEFDSNGQFLGAKIASVKALPPPAN
jgi:hypothetical protein